MTGRSDGLDTTDQATAAARGWTAARARDELQVEEPFQRSAPERHDRHGPVPDAGRRATIRQPELRRPRADSSASSSSARGRRIWHVAGRLRPRAPHCRQRSRSAQLLHGRPRRRQAVNQDGRNPHVALDHGSNRDVGRLCGSAPCQVTRRTPAADPDRPRRSTSDGAVRTATSGHGGAPSTTHGGSRRRVEVGRPPVRAFARGQVRAGPDALARRHRASVTAWPRGPATVSSSVAECERASATDGDAAAGARRSPASATLPDARRDAEPRAATRRSQAPGTDDEGTTAR